jgi:DNA topoisomerase-1
VALRLIVDREREIEAFKPDEYWTIEAKVKDGEVSFIATLLRRAGEKIVISDQKTADQIESELRAKDLLVSDVKDGYLNRSPYAPFTTSTLQQASSNRLGFTSKKTMMLAQQLYEGVELGAEGHVGLITYMRTDSLNLAESSLSQARDFIGQSFGQEYLPAEPRRYKTKSKGAQEAHEAIRPTQASRTPESLKGSLNRDQTRLYELIWQRFLASQMAEARYKKRSIDITSGEYLLRASGSKLEFAGWLKVYEVSPEDESKDEESGHTNDVLPEVKVGEKLTLLDVAKDQHFTEPPARYSEATLIKALEEYGIGRPSTYAPIISTIIDRLYVERVERRLIPSPLGVAVNDFIVKNFSDIVDLNFTAKMEEDLDRVAAGEQAWQPLIAEFYAPFIKHLDEVGETAQRVKVIPQLTDQKCPECGKPIVIRIGRFGKFLACSGYPECKHTEKYIEKVDAKCPEDGGDIVLLRTRKGRPFYGCCNYPNCKYMSWRKPVAKDAPAPETPEPKTA